MFYSNKSSILVSGEGNSSRSKMTSFMRILNLKRIVFLMCIVSSLEITCGMKDNEAALKNKIEVEKLGSDNEAEPNFKYTVGFLGDTKVGKTQIINQHVKGSFEEEYKSTVWPDFKTQKYKSTINEDNSQIIELNIWDTAGEKKYRSLSLNYIKDARAIVLVYDVTKKESFNQIENWLGLAKEYTPNCKNYFLVGNKADLGDKRQIQTVVAENYAMEKNMKFFEVSAQANNNIDELFKDIVKECLIKEEDIIKAIKEDGQENSQKNNNESKVNKEATTPTTPTNNKRCSCCPCNK